MATEPKDWRQMSPREHLALALEAADKAMTGTHSGDHRGRGCGAAAARWQQAADPPTPPEAGGPDRCCCGIRSTDGGDMKG
jgi:hypothetical protein